MDKVSFADRSGAVVTVPIGKHRTRHSAAGLEHSCLYFAVVELVPGSGCIEILIEWYADPGRRTRSKDLKASQLLGKGADQALQLIRTCDIDPLNVFRKHLMLFFDGWSRGG